MTRQDRQRQTDRQTDKQKRQGETISQLPWEIIKQIINKISGNVIQLSHIHLHNVSQNYSIRIYPPQM